MANFAQDILILRADMNHLNLIGPQVRKLREERDWSPLALAEKLQAAGLDISQSSLARVEAGSAKVHDFELFYFARVFGVELRLLFPSVHQNDPELQERLILLLKDSQE